ncbi:hypothetical protein TWF281_006497 [Arthrobotrys megalospora]
MYWKVPTGTPMQLAKGVDWKSLERKRNASAMGLKSCFASGIDGMTRLKASNPRKRVRFA